MKNERTKPPVVEPTQRQEAFEPPVDPSVSDETAPTPKRETTGQGPEEGPTTGRSGPPPVKLIRTKKKRS